jgi:hypothetical protein
VVDVAFLKGLLGSFGSAGRPTIRLEDPKCSARRETRVVGTMYYQKSAERVVRLNHEDEKHRIDFVATLIPEPNNPHDRNAIAVYGAGRKIGHLSREDAARYRGTIARLAIDAIVTVPATIYAGHHGGSSWEIGLKLPPPEQP